ncbi:HAD-IIIC family phosphatase [Brevibacillus antibioticus]|uniref:HAD-IIIC family phosphatase n=1 Tax=Brevibacillus antibioticus TaxID=2570228 RepID=A0A4U2Y5P2_9BACL|nr:HAD-IIIC family phosphatase [Brevibacillus antibioticus]TKI55062.1 HAD-IIIC family phosphatase [Brevibacillus antibioticus]
MVQSKFETGLAAEQKKIKCLVWDLDHTLWHGVLLEDDNVKLRENVVNVIKTLDSRGILQSIASKNEYGQVMEKLQELGLTEYFLYPQIDWNPKSQSLKAISDALNINLDTIAFIDDQPYELEEVAFTYPEVLTINADRLNEILEMKTFTPTFNTEDSKQRRFMYLSDLQRKVAEEEYMGPQESFLASLNMVLSIVPASAEDLQRAEELTVRTNQLNTTGYTYSYEELEGFLRSSQHKLFVASLDDKFGTYGKIGLVLIEITENVWNLKLLLMSCRVMSRGVGSIMLNYIMQLAQKNNVRLLAEFIRNDRNRMMYITLKMAGFREVANEGNKEVLEAGLSRSPSFPDYVKIHVTE